MNLGISALNYVNSIKNGDFTAEEFIEKSFERIKEVDDNLHAFLSFNDIALEKAKGIDRRISSNQKIGQCFGMPISVKDNMCVEGTKTTCASKVLENFISPYTGTAVSRLEAEDAIIIGKTNLDEFAMGLSTEFSAYGPVKILGILIMFLGGHQVAVLYLFLQMNVLHRWVLILEDQLEILQVFAQSLV